MQEGRARRGVPDQRKGPATDPGREPPAAPSGLMGRPHLRTIAPPEARGGSRGLVQMGPIAATSQGRCHVEERDLES
jgi:hypothetical protein